MPRPGATTDENNRPPFDKGGLQGGGTIRCLRKAPFPPLCKEANVIFRGGRAQA